ncbi:MAG: glutathione synthase, partial [Colwellia sp.]
GKQAAKPRTLDFIQRLNNGENIEFNEIVNPGGGEVTEEKRVAAIIFSIYNTSSQLDQFKRQMDLEDAHEMCDLLGVEKDNTLIVLFKRGDYDEVSTQEKTESLDNTRIKHNSVFDA